MNHQHKQQKISLILLTKNESTRIQSNFNWLKKCNIINELVLVDDYSTDTTITQIKKLKSKNLNIKIFHQHLNQNFSLQRQFAIKQTTNNWVLWLDADETPSPQFIKFLNQFNFPKNINAFSFKRQDKFLGQQLKHGETAHLYFTRLFNKNKGNFSGAVHEIWHSRGVVQKKSLTIYHQPHQNLTQLLKKINFYTDIRSKQLFQQKQKTNLFQIIFYPTAKFIQNYFFRLGFLDSTPGIIIALSMSLHSFLVRAKLWQLQQSSA